LSSENNVQQNEGITKKYGTIEFRFYDAAYLGKQKSSTSNNSKKMIDPRNYEEFKEMSFNESAFKN
jgi:hypothetical protein